jgi:hypothetical protein
MMARVPVGMRNVNSYHNRSRGAAKFSLFTRGRLHCGLRAPVERMVIAPPMGRVSGR